MSRSNDQLFWALGAWIKNFRVMAAILELSQYLDLSLSLSMDQNRIFLLSKNLSEKF